MREPSISVQTFIRLAKHFVFEEAATAAGNLAVRNAEQIIQRFGGQRIGIAGAGRDLAASDVCFYCSLCPDEDAEAAPWRGRVGVLAAFASAQNDHIVCLVGASGHCYAFTVPDGKLYEIGSTVGEAMERLLLGFSYGPSVPRDA